MFGVGYVGLTAGICFASQGNHVLCVDIDVDKISLLKKKQCPIYEPGLEELLNTAEVSQNISFTSKLDEALVHGKILFIAVGTPVDASGKSDLSALFEISQFIGKSITETKIIVIKSTVPVGTCQKIRSIIQRELSLRKIDIEFHLVSNPEFLREGCALEDFLNPDRVVVGLEEKNIVPDLRQLYLPFVKNDQKFIVMSTKSSELLKYAANAFLATKISFINEVSRVSESTGADIDSIRQGLMMDPRIGSLFLDAGLGYGGSCLPKDVKVLASMGENLNLNLPLIQNIGLSNQMQKKFFLDKIISKTLKAKIVCVWGLSFKPNTDDIREAPALEIIDHFIHKGVRIQVYDPAASEKTRGYFNLRNSIALNKKIHFASSPEEALIDADALIICTEWGDFKKIDVRNIKNLLNTPLVIDGRNIFCPRAMSDVDIDYYPIGNFRKT